MFDIAFISRDAEMQPEGWEGLWGQTTLGDSVEGFLAPLSLWQRVDYERHWIEAAQRLLGPAAESAFFTVAFQFWWLMRRKGEAIVVRQELLMHDRLANLTDFSAAPYHLIREYCSIGEDGCSISEWNLSVTDIEDFLTRKRNQ